MMSERSLFLSEQIASSVLQKPALLEYLQQQMSVDELDSPYSQALALLARLAKEGPVDLTTLQVRLMSVSPGLPNGFIPDLMFKGNPLAIDLYINEFREGLARRTLGTVGDVIGQAARTADLRMGINRVREIIEDAENILVPQSLPLLDGDLLWDYEPPVDSVLLPGLMWRQSRVVITGFEGDGKSVILRQMAMAGALGLHPFKPWGRVEPIRTLMLDLENPASIAQTAMRSMLDTLRRRDLVPDGTSFEDRFKFLVRTEGVDVIGKGRDREWVTRAVATHRPDLLCVGPVYRLAAAGGNLDEEKASAVLDFLNHLRSTYDVAIVTEAHAAKGTNDTQNPNRNRPLVPSGSGVWLRFPEVGRGMRYHEDASRIVQRRTYKLEQWRRDRSLHMRFPDFVSHGVDGDVWADDTSEEILSQLRH